MPKRPLWRRTICGSHAHRRNRCRGEAPSRSLSEPRKSGSFGIGNHGVTLLVDSCEIADASTVGDGSTCASAFASLDATSARPIASGPRRSASTASAVSHDTTYAFRSAEKNAGNARSSRRSRRRRGIDAVDALRGAREGSRPMEGGARRPGRQRRVRSSPSSSGPTSSKRSLGVLRRFRAYSSSGPRLARRLI